MSSLQNSYKSRKVIVHGKETEIFTYDFALRFNFAQDGLVKRLVDQFKSKTEEPRWGPGYEPQLGDILLARNPNGEWVRAFVKKIIDVRSMASVRSMRRISKSTFFTMEDLETEDNFEVEIFGLTVLPKHIVLEV